MELTELILTIIGIYLIIGIVAIGLLEIITGRVHKKIYSAVEDTKSRLAVTGNYMGNKSALILTVFALWIFWVAVIYAALASRKDKNTNGES